MTRDIIEDILELVRRSDYAIAIPLSWKLHIVLSLDPHERRKVFKSLGEMSKSQIEKRLSDLLKVATIEARHPNIRIILGKSRCWEEIEGVDVEICKKEVCYILAHSGEQVNGLEVIEKERGVKTVYYGNDYYYYAPFNIFYGGKYGLNDILLLFEEALAVVREVKRKDKKRIILITYPFVEKIYNREREREEFKVSIGDFVGIYIPSSNKVIINKKYLGRIYETLTIES